MNEIKERNFSALSNLFGKPAAVYTDSYFFNCRKIFVIYSQHTFLTTNGLNIFNHENN